MNNQQSAPRSTQHRHRLAPLALALALAACGGSDSDDSDGTTTTPPVTTPPVTTPPVTTGGFDTFSSALLDRSKWQVLELVRDIGSAQLDIRKYFGDQSFDRSQLRFAQTGIGRIKATVTVDAIELDDASTNDARARARILGSWFHTDGEPVDGSIGDVFAHLAIQQSVGGSPRIVYFIGQCQDVSCATTDAGVFADLGPATLGQDHVLEIAWTGTEFVFGVDGTDTQVASPYADGGPPNSEFKFLRSEVQRLDGDGEGAYIRARFDTIEVDGQAYDDFSSGRFDETKWLDTGAVPAPLVTRVIDDGVLHSRLSAPGGTSQTNQAIPVLQGNPALAAADVTVAEASRSGGSEPRARVGAYWYHSGAATTGNEGDVFADVSLTETGSGLVARALAILCTNPGCSTSTFLFDDKTTLGSVATGETKRLEISWDGNQFTYKAGEASVTFAPGAEAPVSGPAQQPGVFIGPRIAGDDAAGEAFIDATFDNIDIETN